MSSAGMPGPMAKRFGYALKRAQHALRSRMDGALRPLSLTAPQYAVLSAVELDAGISNASLARAAFVTPQSMHGVLANLIRDGLLLREPDPVHGRILRSSLTTNGQHVLAEAHKRVREVEDVMIASIGTEEAMRLAAALSQCAKSLGETIHS
jgi:DNA-binding MarR family transcriptional regulator